MSNYLPSRDSELSIWLQHFAENCQTYETALHLTPIQVGSILDACGEFPILLNGIETAKFNLESAVTLKDTKKATTLALIRNFSQKFRADVTVPADLLSTLGLAPRNPVQGQGILNPPLDLVATPNAQTSSVLLKWKRNESTQGTNFLIEQRIGTGSWTTVTATTKTRLELSNVTAGVLRSYRVKATRKGIITGPSNIAVVYDNSSGASLTVLSNAA